VIAQCDGEFKTIYIAVKGVHEVQEKQVKWLFLRDNGWREETVAVCFGQYAFLAKEGLPGGLDVFGYKAFEEVLACPSRLCHLTHSMEGLLDIEYSVT
jgi:hypothetical protein